MNTEIERLLRTAPKLTPPPGLKDRLIKDVPTQDKSRVLKKSVTKAGAGGWLRRWWPALVPGAISAACAVVLSSQQETIRELKGNIQTLSQVSAGESNVQPNNTLAEASTMSREFEEEINRLKETAARLKSEIEKLQALKSDNLKLRAQIAAPPDLGLTAEETAAMAKAREKALSIACVNNLKQFGLAVRIWALDNNDSNPPNVLCMSNELSTPKILVCPADTMHQVAPDWSSFTMANCSYEFLVPNEKEPDREPQRVLSRCPIHGHIGMCDGSVQSSVAKNHPDWLVERDGKLYFDSGLNPSIQTQPNPTTPTNLTEEQDRIYRQRYGLPPQSRTAPH